jgi:hypothetical protein
MKNQKDKALLINAEKRTINFVEVGGFEDIQSHLGCDCFTTGMRLPENDVLWVDDNGWMTQTKAFTFMGNVFAGNGLITGQGAGGEEADVYCGILAAKLLTGFMKDDAEVTDDMREKAFDSWRVEMIE